jgi:hypothetical protein
MSVRLADRWRCRVTHPAAQASQGHPAESERTRPGVTPSRSARTSGPRLAAGATDGLRKKTARGGKGRRSACEGGSERPSAMPKRPWRHGAATGSRPAFVASAPADAGRSGNWRSRRASGSASLVLPGPRTRRLGARHGARLRHHGGRGRTHAATVRSCGATMAQGAIRARRPARAGRRRPRRGTRPREDRLPCTLNKCTAVRTSSRSKASRDSTLSIRSRTRFLATGNEGQVADRQRSEVRGGNERGDAPRLRGGGVLRGV